MNQHMIFIIAEYKTSFSLQGSNPPHNEPRHKKTGIFAYAKTKTQDRLRGNSKADQNLCYRYTDSAMPLLDISEFSDHLDTFCGCTVRFVLDLGGNPEDRFSQNEAQIRAAWWEALCRWFWQYGQRPTCSMPKYFIIMAPLPRSRVASPRVAPLASIR